MDDELSIYSLNTNGLGDKIKRKTIFRELQKYKNSIFLLQETHSKECEENIWNNQWGNSKTIFSHGDSNSRGVAIFFSHDMNVNIINEYRDKNGRIIIIDIEIGNSIYTIVNLYAPTSNYEKQQVRDHVQIEGCAVRVQHA